MATEQQPSDADADSESPHAGAPDAYHDLLDRYRQVTYLNDSGMLLSWDQQVMMPEGGTPARSKQQSALSSVGHEKLTADAVGDLLDEVEGADLTADQAAVVREIRREYEREAAVPQELVERISEETSNALPVWEQAREASDWEQFAPTVETLLELKREYAEHIDPDADPYAVLFADYEPYLDLEVADRVLTRLREELVPIIDAIAESDVTLAEDAFDDEYDPDVQEEVARGALDELGYPWEHGRLDRSTHPFSTGNQFDARVTTRFAPDDPVDALSSTIHEFGHATYTLGLREDEYGTPLGSHRGLSVHESQSRLWENHVGRSEHWWEHFLPTFQEHFPSAEDLTPRDAFEAANQVYDDNLIRVEADELTYHMHIVLRYEIEQDLVHGDLAVEDVPGVWNDKMDEYLGIRPDDDATGCLQDIHWSHGSFGYFPTYTLGSVMAAQLYAAAAEDIDDLEGKISRGEFDDLHDWLTENVHRHGAKYETNELVKQATGEEFTADYFLDYVREKYGKLYDLDL
ncbi:carboxypeptidase M32 [Haloglomus salinum]|uniref:carboxypeptidase M32 n=1 Tax=Haloglomus salinum TaxID=2962673 RepID=UPI0020C94FB4|nr:carboxypeptidase M32 [Haloglomus salinum]